MPELPLSSIEQPTHVLTLSTILNPIQPNEVLATITETYSGFVLLQAKEAEGTLRRYEYKVFLPVSGQPLQLREYDDPQDALDPDTDSTSSSSDVVIFDVATNVSLAGIAPRVGGDYSVSAIDAASVGLEAYEFIGITGPKNVLVLSFDIGIRYTEIIRVAYTVTVVSRDRRRKPFKVPAEASPKR